MTGLRIAAMVGCTVLLCGDAVQAQSQPQVSPTPERTGAYVASLELIRDKPYVEVVVNGRGPFRFLVDTGTGGEALVSPELADELALPTVGHARLVDPSGIGQQRAKILEIRSLNLGGAEFRDIKAVEHRLYSEEDTCKGVLGFTLFRDYLLTLDFPGRHLILTHGTLKADADGSVLLFRMPDGVPIVPMRIDGQHFEAQIDSGGTGLSLPQSVAARLKFMSTPVLIGSAESLSTRFFIRAARLRPDVLIGPYSFKQAFVEINAAFPLMNFGSTPMQHFMITFDQANLLVRLHSNEKSLRLDASPMMMQMVNEPRKQASDARLVPIG